MAAVAHDTAITFALSEEVQATTQLRLVHAPYAAWLFAQEKLQARAFGPRGGKRAWGNKGTFKALQVITKELNYVDTHPAFFGQSLFGLHMEMFPAWVLDPPVAVRNEGILKRFSPYPQPGNQFVILAPKYLIRREKVELTWWVPKPYMPGRLNDEAIHLPLWRRPFR